MTKLLYCMAWITHLGIATGDLGIQLVADLSGNDRAVCTAPDREHRKGLACPPFKITEFYTDARH